MVSVIIDNYNYSKYISEAIESVFKQTYNDWEIIVVDDGSTDDSRRIIKDYQVSYPNKIYAVFKENGGQASCFNVGLSKSRGEIIAFLDSDDYWFPEKLERIVDAHRINGYVGHGKKYSNGYKQHIDTIYNDRRSEFLRKYGVMDTYDITSSSLSLTRELADKIFPIPEEDFRICADHYIKMAAMYYENPYYIQEELFYYRIHDDNAYVSQSSTDRATYGERKLNYQSIELFNRYLLEKNPDASPIPHRCRRLTEEFWKEVGEGFSLEFGRKYVIYATGADAPRFLKEIVDRESEIIAFADSSESKWGRTFMTKEIWSVKELVRRREEYDFVVIGSQNYYASIEDKLKENGLKRHMDYIYTPLI